MGDCVCAWFWVVLIWFRLFGLIVGGDYVFVVLVLALVTMVILLRVPVGCGVGVWFVVLCGCS